MKITWKSDMILRMAVSTMLTVATLARFLPLALFSDDAGQSNMCSVSHMQSCADWNSLLKAAVFSNSSTQPFSPIDRITSILTSQFFCSFIRYEFIIIILYSGSGKICKNGFGNQRLYDNVSINLYDTSYIRRLK